MKTTRIDNDIIAKIEGNIWLFVVLHYAPYHKFLYVGERCEVVFGLQ